MSEQPTISRALLRECLLMKSVEIYRDITGETEISDDTHVKLIKSANSMVSQIEQIITHNLEGRIIQACDLVIKSK